MRLVSAWMLVSARTLCPSRRARSSAEKRRRELPCIVAADSVGIESQVGRAVHGGMDSTHAIHWPVMHSCTSRWPFVHRVRAQVQALQCAQIPERLDVAA